MEKSTLELPFGGATRPHVVDLASLAHEAAACRACALWEHATQIVFGEGHAPAPLMLVGEQPGNDEDLQGRPFVGPAGKLLDEALQAADIARDGLYVTNAVKHFKFEPRGKRRIHQKPTVTEVRACKGWLTQEIAKVRPKLIVCLGATAALSLLGRDFKLTRQRGVQMDSEFGLALATYHPSAVLRAPDPASKAMRYDELVADLRLARQITAR